MKRPPLFLKILLCFLLLFLAACGRDDDTAASASLGTGDVRWASFPVAVEVDQRLLLDSDAHDDLLQAMSFWEAKAGKRLFTVKGPWDPGALPYTGNPEDPDNLLENVIFLESPWPFAPTVAGRTIVRSTGGTIENSVVLLKEDSRFCAGNCAGDAATTTISRRKLIAHELGHLLGFGHTTSPRDLMYPDILTPYALDSLEVDTDLLQKLTN
jgi:hypothetical protein